MDKVIIPIIIFIFLTSCRDNQKKIKIDNCTLQIQNRSNIEFDKDSFNFKFKLSKYDDYDFNKNTLILKLDSTVVESDILSKKEIIYLKRLFLPAKLTVSRILTRTISLVIFP